MTSWRNAALLAVVVLAASPQSFASSADEGQPLQPPPSWSWSPPDVPIPTAAQLAWMRDGNGVGAIVHFNMGTFESCGIGSEEMTLLEGNGPPVDKRVQGKGNTGGGFVPPPDAFAPASDVDTDQWVRTLSSFGVSRAVLVASHGCGFNIFPSRTSFPEFDFAYNYTIAQSSTHHHRSSLSSRDIAREFVDSCRRNGIQPGFYHGAMNNAYLNVVRGKVLPGTSCAFCPDLTQEQYERVLLANLRQLWTDYGPLSEVWFDGGYPENTADALSDLLEELQPGAVAFQGPPGAKNVIRWVGTESGHPRQPFWSTAESDRDAGPGSPSAAVFAPGEADTCFQASAILEGGDDTSRGPYNGCWFYNGRMQPKSLEELVSIYHSTVGSNTYLLLDLTPDQTGVIPRSHVQRYKELGEWLNACYYDSKPVAEERDSGGSSIVLLNIPPGASIDRVVLEEDQSRGQLVRNFSVSVDGVAVADGQSVGNKKIVLLDHTHDYPDGALVNVTIAGIGGFHMTRVAAYNCSYPVGSGDTETTRVGSTTSALTQRKPCRSDTDCDLLSSGTGWRCGHDAFASGPTSICHLPGPETTGNSTCSCAAAQCRDMALTPRNASLKQYLMIGDSISLGMKEDLTEILASKGIEVTHVPGNAASSNYGWHCLDNWLQVSHRRWDLITFNFGLHDLAYDTERISIDQYRLLMRRVVEKLVDVQEVHNTALVWVTTTPVPTVPYYGSPGCNDTTRCLNPPRFDDDVVLYNLAAAEVIKDAIGVRRGGMGRGAKIATSDLYAFVLQKCGGRRGYSKCPGFQLPSNVHYTDDGFSAMAARLARDVVAQLEELQPQPLPSAAYGRT